MVFIIGAKNLVHLPEFLIVVLIFCCFNIF